MTRWLRCSKVMGVTELPVWQNDGGDHAGADSISSSSSGSCGWQPSLKRAVPHHCFRSIAYSGGAAANINASAFAHQAGNLTETSIPIRTFAEWDEQQPGFAEIDLVAHDGGPGAGGFLSTLDLTDVCTGWTETEAVPNKLRFGCSKHCRRSVRVCLFLCVAWILTMDRSSSQRITALLSARAHHVHARSSLSQE